MESASGPEQRKTAPDSAWKCPVDRCSVSRKSETTRGEKKPGEMATDFYSGRASASFLRQLLGELEGRETVVSTRVDQFWSKWKSCSLERGTGSNRAGSDGADGRMEWRQSVLAVQLYRRVERKWKFRTLAWYHSSLSFSGAWGYEQWGRGPSSLLILFS